VPVKLSNLGCFSDRLFFFHLAIKPLSRGHLGARTSAPALPTPTYCTFACSCFGLNWGPNSHRTYRRCLLRMVDSFVPAIWRRPSHSITSLLCHREGKALGVPAQSNERRRSASFSRSAAQATAPLHGATPTGDVAASRAPTRPLRHRRSADSRSECASGARTARREARAPAGQLKDSAPSRSAAGKSAPSENPAHQPTLPIVTQRAKTTGLVRAARRAGRPKGSVQFIQ
jgi:hypothetical protein